MRMKGVICYLVFSFIYSLCLAQETAEKPQIEVTPLLTVSGRVISKGRDIVLITQEGKGYLLTETETLEEVFAKVKELADENMDVTISGFDTGETKGFRFIDHKTKKAKEESYRILQVALINKVEQGSKITELDISKPVDYESLPKEVTSPLMLIKGRISKCNFKTVIPTIELEGKEGFILMLTSETQVAKTVGDNLMIFKPKDVLKEGDEIEVWYREDGYQNIAQMITMLERDILSK